MNDDAKFDDARKKRPRRKREKSFLVTPGACSLSLFDLTDLTEDQAMERVAKLRWPENDGKPVCPHCGSVKYYDIRSRRRYVCAGCEKQFSVTSGTIFHSRKLSYKKLLVAIYLFISGSKGEAALHTKRMLKLNHKSVWVLFQKFREAVDADLADRVLSGTVEMDGAYFGGWTPGENTGRAGKRAAKPGAKSKSRKQCVVAVVERGHGKAIAKVVEKENQVAAIEIAKKHIDTKAILNTDEHPSYDALHARYDMRRINHQKEWVNGDTTTNSVENFHGRMRRAALGIYHRISGKHLERYAQEMAFRHSTCRWDNGRIFDDLLRITTHHPQSRQWKGSWQKRPCQAVSGFAPATA